MHGRKNIKLTKLKLMTGELTKIHFSRKFAGKFQQYDNGCSKDGNGSNGEECDRATDPAEYDLSKITIPIDLHYADNDWLAAPAVRIVTVQTIVCLRKANRLLQQSYFLTSYIIIKVVYNCVCVCVCVCMCEVTVKLPCNFEEVVVA